MDNQKNNRIVRITLEQPSLKNNTADADRLKAALKKKICTQNIHIDLKLLRQIPFLLRQWDYKVCCILFKQAYQYILLGIRDINEQKPAAGIAVDLGTTRVVLRLINLSNGQTLGELSFDNPQIEIGPDILARIHYTDIKQGLEHIQEMIINGLNQAVDSLCSSCSLSTGDVYLFSVAGNTAMTHLFMGITPHWMIREPYIPGVNNPGVLKADELGIKASPFARVLIFPNVGSYFGGDLIAGILFSGMNQAEDVSILVDVGTNAEVILGNKDWLIACAGAAGPALESGVARMGMMAGPGVIDTFEIDPDTLEFKFKTIGDIKPKGMCGSGIIDLAAQLFLSGMLDIRGKLVTGKCADRVKEKDGMLYLTAVSGDQTATGLDLTISQADIDSLIRSKAAMYTILRTITLSVGIELRDLKTFYVAGTFGSFIKPGSAISLGMLPDLPLESYKPLGNSSLGGAAMALTKDDCIEDMEKIRDQITYIELNVNQELMNRFSAARFLPHTDLSLFPSVKVWG
ncbi:DUF4445 [Desulfonema limicola]|uniref:DUF4445 n=1 Tax=Desulfonema limicola TaxID=45656 RepID=A0A975B6D2_9BACT|nr:ASKHA domain-containing protein [Desulfonema limicola]QTA79562.1 DUF4445 [Desulfonema limicola]